MLEKHCFRRSSRRSYGARTPLTEGKVFFYGNCENKPEYTVIEIALVLCSGKNTTFECRENLIQWFKL